MKNNFSLFLLSMMIACPFSGLYGQKTVSQETLSENVKKDRARTIWTANQIYFTRTKDQSRVYAFTEIWPSNELQIPSVTPKKGSKIFMLGYDTPLQWSQTKDGIQVIIPDTLQTPGNRPCKYAWGFRIEVSARMLRETDDLIFDIADDCGFDSICHFNKVYN
jgi:hypothetical protein